MDLKRQARSTSLTPEQACAPLDQLFGRHDGPEGRCYVHSAPTATCAGGALRITEVPTYTRSLSR